MSSEQDLDKNAQATPYKLEKAREKGQVAKSAEVVSFTVLAAAVVFASWLGVDKLLSQFRFDMALLTQALAMSPSQSGTWYLVEQMLGSTALVVAPFMAVLMVAAVLANLAQTGVVLSFEPLKMDIQRINPVSGLKRVFSMRTLFDAVRATVKLVTLVAVACTALRGMADEHFHGIAALTAQGFLKLMVSDMVSLCFKLLLALLVIAALDFLYTRFEFNKKMRMSQRELKDEHKNREGDPRIKARMRELREENLKRSKALRSTQGADVLITNPTHVAIALKYEHGAMHSPLMLAKGQEKLAAAMRDVAYRHQIPIVHSPALARRLYAEMVVDQHVPPDLYAPVARIIVWIFAMREARRAAAPSAGAQPA
jgi:flagellar biosynthesis protein FlhB